MRLPYVFIDKLYQIFFGNLDDRDDDNDGIPDSRDWDFNGRKTGISNQEEIDWDSDSNGIADNGKRFVNCLCISKS